jgi:hypothetical protein
MPDDDVPTSAPEYRGPTTGFPASLADGVQALPATVGRYRILRLLGEGGMGAVYEAEQDIPQRTVALKVIRAGSRPVKCSGVSRTRHRLWDA